MNVARLNSLDRSDAAEALEACCGSEAWVDRMIGARPFRDSTAILTTAEEAWWDLGADDWLEAFAVRGESPAGEYEEKFGYPYLVHAADRSDADLEELYRLRLGNDALSELSATATEQARLTNLRLRRLLDLA